MAQRTRMALSGVATGLAILAIFTGACDGGPIDAVAIDDTGEPGRPHADSDVGLAERGIHRGDTPIVITGSGFLLGRQR